jgi:hypothetical protein
MIISDRQSRISSAEVIRASVQSLIVFSEANARQEEHRA